MRGRRREAGGSPSCRPRKPFWRISRRPGCPPLGCDMGGNPTAARLWLPIQPKCAGSRRGNPRGRGERKAKGKRQGAMRVAKMRPRGRGGRRSRRRCIQPVPSARRPIPCPPAPGIPAHLRPAPLPGSRSGRAFVPFCFSGQPRPRLLLRLALRRLSREKPGPARPGGLSQLGKRRPPLPLRCAGCDARARKKLQALGCWTPARRSGDAVAGGSPRRSGRESSRSSRCNSGLRFFPPLPHPHPPSKGL